MFGGVIPDNSITMQIKKDIKIIISISLLIAINLLFINKYLGRVTEYAGIGTFIMLIIYIFIWIAKDKVRLSDRLCNQLNKWAVLVFFLLSIIMFKAIAPESLIVDRWSGISSFWEASFNHEYPYFAISHLGNLSGPMPVYFILALPFYLLGEIGYMSLFALFIFIFFIEKMKIPATVKLWSSLFLMGSAYLLWEIVCRSTIFFNSIIILGCIVWFNSINKQENIKSLYFWAFAIGLSLSTRSVFAIPVIISSLAALRRKEVSIKNMIIVVLIAGITFIITFLPLLIIFPENFFRFNPFILQSSYLMPFHFSVCFLILAIGASFLCKSGNDDYFYSGLVLFLTILGYFIYHIIESGFTSAYYSSISDISYFILCAPFLQYYILREIHKEQILMEQDQNI
ncbi:MAG: hypothetical protein NT144_02780 [Bacteroidia bacterium]|nr:hypothetical protein [Bacteroidia bacterium]